VGQSGALYEERATLHWKGIIFRDLINDNADDQDFIPGKVSHAASRSAGRAFPI
jgi:hypothetical protein